MIGTETRTAEELVTLIRGFFSLPVLSGLARLGALNHIMSETPFTASDFPEIKNTQLLQNSFQYLASIGLIEHSQNQVDAWQITELGKQILQRSSSFHVPHSYHEYMDHYFRELQNPSGTGKHNVDRLENVIGSGKTHQRYFPYAVSFLKKKVEFDVIADLGCGDGFFLASVLKNIPGKKAVGIDVSEIATQTTSQNLKNKYADQMIGVICSDAGNIDQWAKELNRLANQGKMVISMWFLLHEISNKDGGKIVKFLSKIYDFFPKTSLIICEIVRHHEKLLAKFKKESIMPEYLFFHDLSGQGVLSWSEYREILNNIPYQLASERLFDEIADENGRQEPSSFIWCLNPK